MGATVATLGDRPMPAPRTAARAARRAELAALDLAALAARLDALADERAELDADVAFGTRRLTTLAAEAARAAATAPEERIDIEAVMHLTGRSRSWIEHNPQKIPGKCTGRRGRKGLWLKKAVLAGLAEGLC